MDNNMTPETNPETNVQANPEAEVQANPEAEAQTNPELNAQETPANVSNISAEQNMQQPMPPMMGGQQPMMGGQPMMGQPMQPMMGGQQPMMRQPMQPMMGQPMMGQQMQQPKPPKPPKPKKPINKKLVRNICIIAAVIVAAVAGVLIYLNTRKITIDLTEYYSFDYEGYDTQGTVSYIFDYEGFCDDYEDKIKIYSGKKLSRHSIEESFLEECLDGGSFDTDRYLTNGDQITFTIEFNDKKALNKYHIKLKTDKIPLTVADLDAVKEINPFEDLEVIFSGVSPYGEAYIQNNSTNYVLDDVYFTLSESYDLSNGDTVTVIADCNNYYSDNYLLEEYGVVLNPTTQDYTVEGLGEYVSELSQIPSETIEAMNQEASDDFYAYVANYWYEEATISEFTYVGNYLLVSKDSYQDNRIIMVYKVTSNIILPEEGVNQTVEYYYYTTFRELIVSDDGTCSLDYSNTDTPSEGFDIEVETESFYRDYFFYGYEDLDTLFNDCVTTNISNYTYESSITE